MFKSALVFFFAAALPAFADQVASPGAYVVPNKPIVFTSPLTYTNAAGQQVTVSGPWIRFQMGVNPTHDQPITIVHVNVQASGKDANGNTTTMHADFDPSTDNYVAANGANCTFSDYGQFDPAGQNPTLVEATSIAGCKSNTPVFYVGGLPTSALTTPGQVNDYNFTLNITLEGWYGTRSNPVERYMSTVTTQTQ